MVGIFYCGAVIIDLNVSGVFLFRLNSGLDDQATGRANRQPRSSGNPLHSES
jgi:hypothetical protein